jgi:hypothetical protein
MIAAKRAGGRQAAKKASVQPEADPERAWRESTETGRRLVSGPS